jgi:hypothetical protein
MRALIYLAHRRNLSNFLSFIPLQTHFGEIFSESLLGT